MSTISVLICSAVHPTSSTSRHAQALQQTLVLLERIIHHVHRSKCASTSVNLDMRALLPRALYLSPRSAPISPLATLVRGVLSQRAVMRGRAPRTASSWYYYTAPRPLFVKGWNEQCLVSGYGCDIWCVKHICLFWGATLQLDAIFARHRYWNSKSLKEQVVLGLNQFCYCSCFLNTWRITAEVVSCAVMVRHLLFSLSAVAVLHTRVSLSSHWKPALKDSKSNISLSPTEMTGTRTPANEVPS